jgi:tryptophan-rich sensory protein
MNKNYTWYSQLKKPSWAPPSWLFGPVWSVLYILIFISFGAVFYKVSNNKLPAIILLPFVLNLFFTYLQFGLRNNYLAAVDVLLVLLTLISSMLVIYPDFRWIALVNIPYLLWVCFATVLQLNVTYLNRKR